LSTGLLSCSSTDRQAARPIAVVQSQAPIPSRVSEPTPPLAALQQHDLPITLLATVEPWQVPFSFISGTAYRIGDVAAGRYARGEGTLYVHPHPTEDDARQAASKVPPTADGGATDWAGRPHFFRCGPVVTIYLDHEDFDQALDANVLTTLTELCGSRFAGGSRE
jgi:hypothetical protein